MDKHHHIKSRVLLLQNEVRVATKYFLLQHNFAHLPSVLGIKKQKLQKGIDSHLLPWREIRQRDKENKQLLYFISKMGLFLCFLLFTMNVVQWFLKLLLKVFKISLKYIFCLVIKIDLAGFSVCKTDSILNCYDI